MVGLYRFARQHSNLNLLCRTKRNGQHAIYHGVYSAETQARAALKKVAVDGYVLRLSNEDMVSCDSSERLLVRSSSVAQGRVAVSSAVYSNDWAAKAKDTFYTIQLAAFNSRRREQRFIRQNSKEPLLCRIRRNGKFAVYQGKFKNFAAARRGLESVAERNAYVVRLTGELLPLCQG